MHSRCCGASGIASLRLSSKVHAERLCSAPRVLHARDWTKRFAAIYNEHAMPHGVEARHNATHAPVAAFRPNPPDRFTHYPESQHV
jgi:hypothetical protein